MTDVRDLRYTIVPKSDQLNAEQLLGGPMIATVTDVKAGGGADQPLSVHYEGENGRPYKPCKTMRKVLIHAWGSDGTQWIGKSMELYNDPSVRFGGSEVGGIRIASMTDIPEKGIRVSLTATKGKKALHEISLLALNQGKTPSADNPDAHTIAIQSAITMDDLRAAFTAAETEAKSLRDAALLSWYRSVKDKRKTELEQPQA